MGRRTGAAAKIGWAHRVADPGAALVVVIFSLTVTGASAWSGRECGPARWPQPPADAGGEARRPAGENHKLADAPGGPRALSLRGRCGWAWTTSSLSSAARRRL